MSTNVPNLKQIGGGHCKTLVDLTWNDPSCLSATERRTTAAKHDDFHSKSLFLVKNKGQWNAKSGPKAAYGNFAMRTKFSERLDSK